MMKLFENPNNWNGGFYELSIELSDNTHTTIRKSLASLWSTPNLEGCFERNDISPAAQNKIPFSELPIDGHLYGIATFPAEKKCECGTYTSDFRESGQWMSLYLPMGALSNIFAVGGFPFATIDDPNPITWIPSLNEWLKEIAEILYPKIDFKLAVLGFEADFTNIREEVLAGNIADERWEGFLVPSNERLLWYPPTNIDHQFT